MCLPYSQTLHVTFGYMAPVVRLSVVCDARAPYSGSKKIFRNIFTHSCTLGIRWLLCKISGRSSQGNPSVGDVICKRGRL